MAAAKEIGLSVVDAANYLAELKGVKGRAEVVETNRDFTIIIDYAHTPDGLLNIINTIRGFAKGRVITLFGCGEKNKEEDINEEVIASYMTTAQMPDPDLLIRTSGELRISNFLLWQLAYSEMYFTPCLWPEFTNEEFYRAIVDYQGRERRFGKTSEQI